MGLAGDMLAGWLFFTEESMLALILHIPCVLLFAFGIQCIQPAYQPSSPLTEGYRLPALSGWTVAALALGVLLFPGVGTIVSALTFGASYMLRARGASASTSSDPSETVHVTALLHAARPQRDGNILPFVDVLGEQDTERRRVVVQMLGLVQDQESVQMIRHLLTDPNPDVRSDAGVVLTRMENEFRLTIQQAREEVNQRRDIPSLMHLATLCERYAVNGLIDPASARLGLIEAHDNYRQVVRQNAQRIDAWVALARVRYRLDDRSGARDALAQALSLSPYHREAQALLFELTFQEHRWGELRSMAQQHPAVPDDLVPLLDWWGDKGSEVEHG